MIKAADLKRYIRVGADGHVDIHGFLVRVGPEEYCRGYAVQYLTRELFVRHRVKDGEGDARLWVCGRACRPIHDEAFLWTNANVLVWMTAPCAALPRHHAREEDRAADLVRERRVGERSQGREAMAEMKTFRMKREGMGVAFPAHDKRNGSQASMSGENDLVCQTATKSSARH
jgi:hypothetical protein